MVPSRNPPRDHTPPPADRPSLPETGDGRAVRTIPPHPLGCEGTIPYPGKSWNAGSTRCERILSRWIRERFLEANKKCVCSSWISVPKQRSGKRERPYMYIRGNIGLVFLPTTTHIRHTATAYIQNLQPAGGSSWHSSQQQKC